MIDIFPDFIKKLPNIDIQLDDCESHLLQSKNHQIVFLKFNKDVTLPDHNHESQWEIVLEGEVILYINGTEKKYVKGDTFFIPSKVNHKAKIFQGYSSIVIFNQKDRYKIKKL
jgi:quercetin dioxygenase-like cupin family protein